MTESLAQTLASIKRDDTPLSRRVVEDEQRAANSTNHTENKEQND